MDKNCNKKIKSYYKKKVLVTITLSKLYDLEKFLVMQIYEDTTAFCRIDPYLLKEVRRNINRLEILLKTEFKEEN
jgi:hypothetical protein